jgi:hypothetical protein
MRLKQACQATIMQSQAPEPLTAALRGIRIATVVGRIGRARADLGVTAGVRARGALLAAEVTRHWRIRHILVRRQAHCRGKAEVLNWVCTHLPCHFDQERSYAREALGPIRGVGTYGCSGRCRPCRSRRCRLQQVKVAGVGMDASPCSWHSIQHPSSRHLLSEIASQPATYCSR